MKPTVLISWPCVCWGGVRENIFQGTDNHYNYVKIANRKHRHQKRNLNKETVIWNLDINMQKWMKVQCSLFLIFFFFFFLSDEEHEGDDEGRWVSACWFFFFFFFFGGQAFCNQINIMNTYSISFIFYAPIGEGTSPCPWPVCFPTY